MISAATIVRDRFPTLEQHPLLASSAVKILRSLLQEREFQSFAEHHAHLEGMDFVDKVLEYFNFSYAVRSNEIERIPASGRVVIVANHPIGSLDGLALLKLVGEIRSDVRIVANELLMAIAPLRPLLLPVDNLGGRTARQNLRELQRFLEQGGAVIIFPAGEVSRLCPRGVRDCDWKTGFLRLADACRAPLLPMLVDGRNSRFFYALSILSRPLSTLWLVREMFKQAHQSITIRVGEPISTEARNRVQLPLARKAQLIRKHTYRLKRDLPGIFDTEKSIAKPEPRQTLRQAIRDHGEVLATTPEGYQLVLYRYRADSVVMREIGRLREQTFREVGEGTGNRRDQDRYDCHYEHLIIWDDATLEIGGAYRFARCDQVLAQQGEGGLYSHSLADFDPAFAPLRTQALELGRSFIVPHYRGKRSLDYLWLGLGAFLCRHPQYRYLFGPVSLSARYPLVARDMIVEFYRRYFADPDNLACARTPYRVSSDYQLRFGELFSCGNYSADFKMLKAQLRQLDLAVPTLYKQYTELTQAGGARFLSFGLDPDFGHCIDGMILVDLALLKPRNRRRYLDGRHGDDDLDTVSGVIE